MRGEKSKGDNGTMAMKINSCIISSLEDVGTSLSQQSRKSKFPFTFTKDVKAMVYHDPLPIRTHVCFGTSMPDGAPILHGGFSFMLCGGDDYEWDANKVETFLKEQTNWFAKFTVNQGVQELINVH